MIKHWIKFFLNLFRLAKSLLRGSTWGKKSEVCRGALVIKSNIGKYCYIGMGSYLNHVQMGNYCSISGSVIIGAMEHAHWDYSTSTHLSNEGYCDHITDIGHDVWIGANCVIRQGVKIGVGAVIGANSFVNKDVPPYSIAFGTPAKIYKYRFSEEVITELTSSEYWNYNPSTAKAILNDLKNK